ncbi:hypothetical protein BKA70DRAFT_1423499 [Coprinopsis sp. MPI-PUGE-AT-0042]|nr:hypothetical protein BKA70DRAFT_1423499 [Coprinopsis sp. MPI-PUGE-AT-0042]
MADTRIEYPLAISKAYIQDPARSIFPVSILKQWDSETTSHRYEAPSSPGLIPEPDGEAGRPGRGGYNLQQKLDWAPGLYQAVRNFAKQRVGETLDRSKPFTAQDPVQVQAVIVEMLASFPILKRYEDNWASKDFIRGCLKNATRHR